MQPQSQTQAQVQRQSQSQYYIRGSGYSACLITAKLDDEPEWVKFQLEDMHIVDVQLSGLFAVAIVEQESEQSKTKHRQVAFWGNLNETRWLLPQLLPLPHKKQVKLISCGWNHALIATEDGVLFGIGQNKYGQLGIHNAGKFWQEPVQVCLEEAHVGVIRAGFRQSYWVTKQKYVYGCGESKNNQLGVINKKQHIPCIRLQFAKPEQAQNIKKIDKVSCGKRFVVILTQDGQLYGLGSNDHKSLWNQAASYQKFMKIGSSIKDIECGWNHIMTLDLNGVARTRGRNNFGQLGRKSLEWEGQIDLQYKCKSIKAGTQFNFAISQDGRLYGWGWNEHMNIINTPETPIINTPTIIPIPYSSPVEKCYTYPAITLIKTLNFHKSQQQ